MESCDAVQICYLLILRIFKNIAWMKKVARLYIKVGSSPVLKYF